MIDNEVQKNYSEIRLIGSLSLHFQVYENYPFHYIQKDCVPKSEYAIIFCLEH